MKRLPSNQQQRENAFGRSCVALRRKLGLTQRALGKLLGISEQAIQQWERGVYAPTSEHLERLLALCLERHAFAPGREYKVAHQLWRAAGRQVSFDASWMRAQLAAASAPLVHVVLKREAAQSAEPPLKQEPPTTSSHFDWRDALDVHDFYGREAERLLLEQWVLEERCRVVSVLGLGGIGKSALSVTFMYQVAPAFQNVVFRSLRDAPPCQDLLADCLQVLSPQLLPALPSSLEQRMGLLLECFQRQRCMLVLDNLEPLLQEHDQEGRFCAGYEDYAALLGRVAQTEHQSCLLLTSREKPRELVPLEGSRAPLRSLRLDGLERAACEQLIEERGLLGSPYERARLIERYGGNPLALKIVAQTVAELFGGEISLFLTGDEVVFGSVRELLEEQFARLSVLEQRVLLWLAILREPVSIEELLAVLGTPLPRMQLLEAVEALRRRSLVERGKQPGSFTLQSVVLEYVTARLIAEAASEIEQGHMARLIEHGLELATSKEDVRQTQHRLIVKVLLAQMRSIYRGREEVEAHLLALLAGLRERADYAQGYGPANLLALLREQRGHLRGLDLSQLAIRAVSLQGVEMQDTTLSKATLRDTTFTEAFDGIWALAISRNGTFWAVSGRQGKVRVWRQGGKILHLAWQTHTDTVMALAFSPDERTLATGSWDGAIKLWGLERDALLWTAWHTDSVNCAVFAPDGGVVASGGNDAVIRLWDALSGTHRQTLSGHTGPVFALAWSPDGRLLASGGFDGGIRLWDLSMEQPQYAVRMLTGHTNWVSGLAFAPDGRTLASASWDRTVKLWDVGEGGSPSARQTLTGHTDWVFRVAWSPDGRLLASCGPDRTIWLWDVEKSSYRTALLGHTAVVHDLAFTSENRSLISGSEDGTLRTWDLESGHCVRIMQGYAVSLYDIDWSPAGTQLASAGSDLLVTIWDGVGRTPPILLVGHRLNVYGVAWSPDGGLVASCGEDNAIRVWDASIGTTVHNLRDSDHVDTLFRCVAWSPDGQWLASGSLQQGVQVWEVSTGSCRWVGHTDSLLRIRRVAWSPDGSRLASGGDDGSVCLWEASDGTLRQRFQGHRGMVMSVAWSPDGKRLASGSGDRGRGELFVWDAHSEVQSGERPYVLSEPSEIVYALAWSPKGAVLVSGGSDGMLRWWDMLRGECVRVRKAHQGAVQSLKLSPEGQRLASCGDDGAIQVWGLESGNLLRTLRRDRPYERLDISGVMGLTDAQEAALRALGALEDGIIAPW